ncbi:MAG: UDP-3-O-acyl-N-acetylglucosamine deacetylase [Candidatus Margulisbacteria bacterium]|nr:UDP-3-O-acyl-N-acetylglucosamine deacetylase [Candidatus Margulisiibacteriota bacterium]
MGFTLEQAVEIESVGIHSGQNVKMRLLPYQGGIVFVHMTTGTEIPLSIENVIPISLGTNLNKGNVWIRTIEHLCAVLWALSITDLKIELEGDEIPIADGSGKIFWDKLVAAGRKVTNTESKVLTLKEPMIRFYDNDIFLMAFPSDELTINYTINFPHVPIKAQNFIFRGRQFFESEILHCRTFGNAEDLAKLHADGKALGAGVDNCLAYDNKGFINEPRFENESVRHKILDLLGDLYASGYDVRAKIIAYKTSHNINNQFLKELLQTLG